MPRQCPPANGSRSCILLAMAVARGLAFPQLVKWDQVSSLFLLAPTPGGTTQLAHSHWCQLPVPLETHFLPGMLLCRSTG